MAQHECVARFYDEHTQDVCNSAGPSTVNGAMKLARRLLDDGRELSKDYEKLQAENAKLRAQRAHDDHCIQLAADQIHMEARRRNDAWEENARLKAGADCVKRMMSEIRDAVLGKVGTTIKDLQWPEIAGRVRGMRDALEEQRGWWEMVQNWVDREMLDPDAVTSATWNARKLIDAALNTPEDPNA